MEIKIRYSDKKSKKIDVDYAVVSIQATTDDIINHLIDGEHAVVVDNKDTFFISNTVIEEINNYSDDVNFDTLKYVLGFLNLDETFYEREIKTLSSTEKIYLNIIRTIARLNSVIIFKDIFEGLDLNGQKSLINIINYLKKYYFVFIQSSDVDVIHRIADYSIISNKTYMKYDKTEEIYSDVPTLNKYGLDVPTLSYITYKAKEEKNVKLFYSRDVRDIIKDIYKHV
jgi:ABC-type multidrug transport system ATPase subunit